jgi:Fic family protein
LLAHLEDQHHLANWLTHRNLARQYDFMNTAFVLWQDQGKPKLTATFINELNFYAAHNLSRCPGEYRDVILYNVRITDTDHVPPDFSEVRDLMSDFIQRLTSMCEDDSPYAAAYALWRLNWIHPFSQGNGRTSRALSYFIQCQLYNKWFPGTIVPELIRENRSRYCELLQQTDKTMDANGVPNLAPIASFLDELLEQQIEPSVQKALAANLSRLWTH